MNRVEAQISARQTGAKRVHERLLNDVRWCLRSPEGRRFFQHLMWYTRVDELGTQDPDRDSAQFKLGQQNVGAHLCELMSDAIPEEDLKVRAEARAQKRRNDHDIEAEINALIAEQGE